MEFQVVYAGKIFTCNASITNVTTGKTWFLLLAQIALTQSTKMMINGHARETKSSTLQNSCKIKNYKKIYKLSLLLPLNNQLTGTACQQPLTDWDTSSKCNDRGRPHKFGNHFTTTPHTKRLGQEITTTSSAKKKKKKKIAKRHPSQLLKRPSV
jgi:hypothetical protein